jgi:hypothetical protein
MKGSRSQNRSTSDIGRPKEGVTATRITIAARSYSPILYGANVGRTGA